MLVPIQSPLSMEKGNLRIRTKAAPTTSNEQNDDRGDGGRDDHREDDAAWMMKTEDEEPLSPFGRLYHVSCLSACIVVIFGFATKIDVDVLKERMEQTLIKHPRLSSKLVLDVKKGEKERWIRTQVNFDDHIIVLNLDPAMEKPDQFIEDYASDLSSSSLDLSKPLWEFHVLNIKTANAESVGIFKIHHSLGDGMSLVALTFSCSRKSSNPEELPSVPTSTKRVSKSSHGAPYRFFIAIWMILKLIWNTLIGIVHILATGFFLKDTDTSLISQKIDVHSLKKIAHRVVSLDDIKLVKNETNTTVNDVAVGLTDAALSRYLHTMHNNRRRKIRLRANIAVNVRKTAGIQDLVDMMKKGSKCKWGNVAGCIIIPFDVKLEKDPLQYVRKAKHVIDQKKLSLEAKFVYYLSLFGARLLGMKLAVHLFYRFLSHATLMLSTVVGPAEEVDFCGHRVAYICATARNAAGHPPGLVIHYMSYMNKMSVAVCANQDLIPDPHKILDEVEESLKDMKNAVLQRKQSKKGLLGT